MKDCQEDKMKGFLIAVGDEDREEGLLSETFLHPSEACSSMTVQLPLGSSASPQGHPTFYTKAYLLSSRTCAQKTLARTEEIQAIYL